MSINIFIAHSDSDRQAASALSDHFHSWGIASSSVRLSSSSRPIGQSFLDRVPAEIRDSQLFVLINSGLGHADWPYCTWELGIAMGVRPKPPRIVQLLLADESPFLPLQALRLQNEDFARFVRAFHREPDFFPASPAFMPELSDEELHARATALFTAMAPLVPPLSRRVPLSERFSEHRIFGPRSHHVSQCDVFIIMPFRDELRSVEKKIRASTGSLGLSSVRADDMFTNQSVLGDLWSCILDARLIVADCTDGNANVFYELGLAHALEKKTILVGQSIRDVPFDLQQRRVLTYDLTPSGLKRFQEDLTDAMTQVLEETGEKENRS